MERNSYRVLLLGNGGREHALAWKLCQSPLVEEIFVVSGNGGTNSQEKVTNIEGVSLEDFASLAQTVREKHVNFLIPGPEAPLVAGVVDYFQQNLPEIQCFGPSKAAARLEGSKAFSKDFMKKYKVPTARYANFKDFDEAKRYIDSVGHDIVIKASGLAAGKGVIIPSNKEEAHEAVRKMLLNGEFGAAGKEVVIEEYLQGEELSIFSFCDGKTSLSFPAAQDYKRVFDNDQGPNTGGMGSYAPAVPATAEVVKTIQERIIEVTLAGMQSEGHPFVGLLFTGIMVTTSGPKVLEYNVRFGDPETQSFMPLLKSDLTSILAACVSGNLSMTMLEMEKKFAVTVVAAAAGYPQNYAKGTEIQIGDVPSEIVIFHAGTSRKDGVLRTSGGRVLAATAYDDELKKAAEKAYKGLKAVSFEGAHYRTDIAAWAIELLSDRG